MKRQNLQNFRASQRERVWIRPRLKSLEFIRQTWEKEGNKLRRCGRVDAEMQKPPLLSFFLFIRDAIAATRKRE